MLARITAVTLVAVAALASGCGSGGSRDAQTLLDQAFSRPIHSATVSIELNANLDGPSGSRPFDLRLSGPYRSNGAHQIPSFDWSLSIVGGAREFTGELASTGDDVYLTIGGTSYDLGAARVAQANAQLRQGRGGRSSHLGIDPHAWVADANVAGSAQAAGVQTTHVHASVDVARMLRDLNQLLAGAGGTLPGRIPHQLTAQQIAAARRAIQSPALDVYVAKSDRTLRRLAVSLAFTIPPSQQSHFAGVRAGSVSVSVELADIGKPVSVQPPPNPQPIAALLGPAATGGSPNPQKLSAYTRCVQAAGTDATAIARCAALLR